MTVLTAIRDRFAGRKADAENEYAKLVATSGKGGDVDLNGLSELLSLTDRSMEDFVADVEKIERRAAARVKLKEAERLKPAYEAASRELGKASDAVDVAREAARKLVDDALENLSDKGNVSSNLSQQISTLTREAREDLLATADPSLQVEIDRLESRILNLRDQYKDVGRDPNANPDEAIKLHRARNEEEARIQSRITELRQQQLA